MPKRGQGESKGGSARVLGLTLLPAVGALGLARDLEEEFHTTMGALETRMDKRLHVCIVCSHALSSRFN